MGCFKRDGQTVADCAALAEALMQALGLAGAERIARAYLELLPRQQLTTSAPARPG